MCYFIIIKEQQCVVVNVIIIIIMLQEQQESLMITGQTFNKKHTLEDLFRPPIDMTFKGTFHNVSTYLCNFSNQSIF